MKLTVLGLLALAAPPIAASPARCTSYQYTPSMCYNCPSYSHRTHGLEALDGHNRYGKHCYRDCPAGKKQCKRYEYTFDGGHEKRGEDGKFDKDKFDPDYWKHRNNDGDRDDDFRHDGFRHDGFRHDGNRHDDFDRKDRDRDRDDYWNEYYGQRHHHGKDFDDRRNRQHEKDPDDRRNRHHGKDFDDRRNHGKQRHREKGHDKEKRNDGLRFDNDKFDPDDRKHRDFDWDREENRRFGGHRHDDFDDKDRDDYWEFFHGKNHGKNRHHEKDPHRNDRDRKEHEGHHHEIKHGGHDNKKDNRKDHDKRDYNRHPQKSSHRQYQVHHQSHMKCEDYKYDVVAQYEDCEGGKCFNVYYNGKDISRCHLGLYTSPQKTYNPQALNYNKYCHGNYCSVPAKSLPTHENLCGKTMYVAVGNDRCYQAQYGNKSKYDKGVQYVKVKVQCGDDRLEERATRPKLHKKCVEYCCCP